MKKYILLITFVLLISASLASAQEFFVHSIVRHRDFFLQLRGYSDYSLCDVEVIEREKIGVILLSPEGFEEHLVFDTASMSTVYANARILNKDARSFLIETSIRMSDVNKLAIAAKKREEELRQGWKLYEGNQGNFIPKNPSSKMTDTKPEAKPAVGQDEVNLTNRNNNMEVHEMDTKEILERLRVEVKINNPEEQYKGIILKADKIKHFSNILKL
jgi:hypothetical protein